MWWTSILFVQKEVSIIAWSKCKFPSSVINNSNNDWEKTETTSVTIKFFSTNLRLMFLQFFWNKVSPIKKYFTKQNILQTNTSCVIPTSLYYTGILNFQLSSVNAFKVCNCYSSSKICDSTVWGFNTSENFCRKRVMDGYVISLSETCLGHIDDVYLYNTHWM